MTRKVLLPLITIIILIIILISYQFLIVKENKNVVLLDESISNTGLSHIKNKDFFKDICIFAISKYDHLFKGVNTPVVDLSPNIYVEKFFVYTKVNSTEISHISFKLSFNHNDTSYFQSFDIINDKIFSYVSAYPNINPTNNDDHKISILDFTSSLDAVDYSYFIDMKPNASMYSFEFVNTTNILYKATSEQERFLNKKSDVVNVSLADDVILDYRVPVILFNGAVEIEENRFQDDSEPLIIYIDTME